MIRERMIRFSYWPQLITVLIIALAYVGYQYVAYYDTRSADAEVAGKALTVSTLVAGPVLRVAVVDGQQVKKGDILLEMDKTARMYALAQAKSRYQHVQTLPGRGDDNARMLEKAALDLAQYQLDQTTVYAPVDGMVNRIVVNPGQYLVEGQKVLDIIDSQHYWIEANYLETIIRLIQPGDKAMIRLSMYPDRVFRGHVSHIDWGANARQASNTSSLQPPQTWIRVARRFPVHIILDDIEPAYPLRLGASATITMSKEWPDDHSVH